MKTGTGRHLWIIKFLVVLLLVCRSFFSFAQLPTDSLPPDPGAISVYTVQNMAFGGFSTANAGGTVVLSTSGTRSTTGSVVPLNLGISYYQAIFEILGPVGTIITILNGPDATLTGSNGGSMTLTIGASNPASPFTTTVAPPGRTQVSIGGTLNVGSAAANPPGNYSGTFYITFNQQ